MKKKQNVEVCKFEQPLMGDIFEHQSMIVKELVEKANGLGLEGKKVDEIGTFFGFGPNSAKYVKMKWSFDLPDREREAKMDESLRTSQRKLFRVHTWLFWISLLYVPIYLFSLKGTIAQNFNSYLFSVSYLTLLWAFRQSGLSLRGSHKRESQYAEMVDKLIRYLRRNDGV